MKHLYHFLRYNKRKRLTIAVYLYTAFYRASILLIPSQKLEKHWGEKGKETPMEVASSYYSYALTISYYVNHIADRTPWESKCLVRALTAQRLMRRKKIPTTLYLGVGKNPTNQMIAHAWLRCGEFYLTGGKGEEYAIVAKFAV